MKKLVWIFPVLFVITGFKVIDYNNTEQTNNLVNNILIATKKINDISYKISNCERINGELKCGSQNIIMQKKPFKCRITFLTPKKGDQVLYNEYNSKEALYIPIGFPYIDLSLDPFGSIMREDNHHTIFELGYSFFSDLIEYNYRLKPKSFSVEDVNSHTIKLTSQISEFRYVKYISIKNESVRDLAQRKMVSEHHIYEKNNEKRVLKKGETIYIPTNYYKKIEIEVSKINHLPNKIIVFDDKGVFEKYTFYRINLSPEIDSKTFINSN
jgi:hypothetical protein